MLQDSLVELPQSDFDFRVPVLILLLDRPLVILILFLASDLAVLCLVILSLVRDLQLLLHGG